MSKDTDNSFFIVSSVPQLYQQLLIDLANYETLGSHLIKKIKAAQAFRQTGRVRELSDILINLPIKEYQLIGQYYLVWCKYRNAEYDTEVLDRIIEQTQTYKTPALSSRGAVEWYKGDLEAAFSFYLEALKTSSSVSDRIALSRTIAVLKATEGFHKAALRDLENLLPAIRYAEPLAYFEMLNSYAVELSEAGRKREARSVSRIVMASPFAFAYPEWQETARDLKEPDHSFVAISPTPNSLRNVLPMPVVEHGKSRQVRYNRPARVLNLHQWKKKMGNEPNGGVRDRKPLAGMTDKEMFLRALELFSNTKIPESKRRKMLETIERILAEPDAPKSDDAEPDDMDGA
jgi:tetratricopeptide (TPR) repeat protein